LSYRDGKRDDIAGVKRSFLSLRVHYSLPFLPYLLHLSCVSSSIIQQIVHCHHRSNIALVALHENKLILLNRLVPELAVESRLRLVFPSFFSVSVLQVLDRRERAEFCNATGGSAFCLSMRLSFGARGLKEPGRNISKPVPSPRTTWELLCPDMLCSNDFFDGGGIGSFNSAAPSEAGMMGEDDVDSRGLCAPLFGVVGCVLSLLCDLRLSGRAFCDVRLQNSVKGVTSGMLDRRIAAGSAAILGEFGVVGEELPDVGGAAFRVVEE
jgi:hypothetical protein